MTADTTTDEATKSRVRDALLDHAKAALRALDANTSSEDRAGRLDQDTSLSIDDISQSDEAGDLGGLSEDAAARQQAALHQIEALDFSHIDQVGPGALVGFDGQRYVVGVVASPFDCDGVTYEGIASDSPIYPLIEGLQVGGTFSFNGHDHTIDFVA